MTVEIVLGGSVGLWVVVYLWKINNHLVRALAIQEQHTKAIEALLQRLDAVESRTHTNAERIARITGRVARAAG